MGWMRDQMEGLIVVIQQLDAHESVLDGRLDQIKCFSHKISNMVWMFVLSVLKGWLGPIREVQRNCKTIMNHEDLIVAKNKIKQ